MQNSLLVIGSKGQLGWELERQGSDFEFNIIGIDVDELDITDSAAVETTLKNMNLSLVINAAAYTAVDKAEAEPDLAFAVNREGPPSSGGSLSSKVDSFDPHFNRLCL